MKTPKSQISELIEAGSKLASLNLLPATSGNLSCRYEDSICITVSGKDKASLNEDDFLLVDFQAQAIDGSNKTPSAETFLHTLIYETFPKANYIYHVHSSSSVVLSKLIGANKEIRLENYELLKAFNGITSHKAKVTIPVFRNSQKILSLAQEIKQFFTVMTDLHAFVLEAHGFYTWGSSHKECLRHVEALDTLLACELELIKLK